MRRSRPYQGTPPPTPGGGSVRGFFVPGKTDPICIPLGFYLSLKSNRKRFVSAKHSLNVTAGVRVCISKTHTTWNTFRVQGRPYPRPGSTLEPF